MNFHNCKKNFKRLLSKTICGKVASTQVEQTSSSKLKAQEDYTESLIRKLLKKRLQGLLEERRIIQLSVTLTDLAKKHKIPLIKIESSIIPSIVEIAKAAGKYAEYALNNLRSPEIGELFVEYPDKFVKLAKATGNNTPYVLYVLIELKAEELFVKYPDEFVKLAKATGKYAEDAFTTLGSLHIRELFLKNPEKLIYYFSEITKASGKKADYALYALSEYGIDDLFVRSPVKFVKLAKVSGRHAGYAFSTLKNPDIRQFFLKNPEKLIYYFSKLAKATGKYADYAFKSLKNPPIRELFLKNPEKLIYYFSEITKASGKKADLTLSRFGNPEIAELFIKYPDEFVKLAKATRKYADEAFRALKNPHIKQLFLKYINKQISLERFLINSIALSSSYAIELGHPLDDFHDRPVRREKYLKNLKNWEVVGLLCSNPDYFYTSTNELLFERLVNDAKNSNKTLLQYLKDIGIWEDDKVITNFLLRAAKYGRIARRKPLFSKAEQKEVIGKLLKPLREDNVNDQYLYYLANIIENLKIEKRQNEDLWKEIRKALKKAKEKGGKRTRIASDFLLDWMKEGKPDTVLNLNNHTSNGKLVILQVFDREDTEKDHWGLTIDYFKKRMGIKNPKIEKLQNGERVIFEDENVKLILFMGNSEENNQNFVKKMLKTNPNLILTFRGHSYSLTDSFPYNIFSNLDEDSHLLFIPGSCGSNADIPSYINNTQSEIKFISNLSTGRGMVTNTLVWYLITTWKTKHNKDKPVYITFEELLNRARKEIESYGSSTDSLSYNKLGERLISYIKRRENDPFYIILDSILDFLEIK